MDWLSIGTYGGGREKLHHGDGTNHDVTGFSPMYNTDCLAYFGAGRGIAGDFSLRA